MTSASDLRGMSDEQLVHETRETPNVGFAVAKTTFGVIGVKVWIDLGDYRDEDSDNGADAKTGQAPQKSKRAHKR